METYNVFMDNAVLALTIIGVLAFLVSVITEVTKDIGFLKAIPTDLQVIVLSIMLCLTTYFSYATMAQESVKWYCVAGCIIGAFIVSFIAMYGWTKLSALYDRFKK